MKRFLLSILIGFPLFAAATPVSPEAALERAFRDSPARIPGSAGGDVFRLTTVYEHEDTDGVYLFTRADGEGFIVTPADDSAPAILGFGTSPAADDKGRVAPEFEYWLSELARQVAYGAEREPVKSFPLKGRPQRDPVEPLCATRWNQSAPYNDLCPEKNGERAVTGCVATAMAQVMKYHNWPEKGIGSKRYTLRNYGRLSINFEDQIFDWDNMLDIYGPDEPQLNRGAVALLMQCTGYSVEMQYSPDGSGASSMAIAEALGEYFKYEKSLSYLFRDYYTLYDWEDIIYQSLVNDGPVIYDGQAGIGGHSFVCDGYLGDGYFHFNWGWGGMSDGYFLLDALDPIHQGIGGADGGFNYYQDIIVGIRPETSPDSNWNATMIINSTLDFSYSEAEGIIDVDGIVYNIGPGPIVDGSIGFRFTPVDGGEPIMILDEIGSRVPVASGFMGFQMEVPDIAPGQYRVEMIYSLSADEAQPKTVLAPVYEPGEWILIIGDDDPVFEPAYPVLPDFVDAVYPAKVDLKEPVNVSGILVNEGDSPMLSVIALALIDTQFENLYAYSTPFAFDLEAAESREVSFDLTLSNVQRRPDVGDTCLIVLTALNVRSGELTLLSEPAETVITDESGVTAVAVEGDTSTGCFSIDGLPVKTDDTGNLKPGIYILKSPSGTKKIQIR